MTISKQLFSLRLPRRTDQIPSPTTVNSFFCLFVCLFVCFVHGYVTTSLYNCLLEVSVDEILSQFFNNAHIYTHIEKHILTYIYKHPRTYKKVLLTTYYSGCLVISSHHKSYQQYFDNLLNDKNLEKFIPIKKSKWNLQ